MRLAWGDVENAAISADARRWWLFWFEPIAREDGGRKDDVLVDSTGVLFLLPIADMLSMMAMRCEEVML